MLGLLRGLLIIARHARLYFFCHRKLKRKTPRRAHFNDAESEYVRLTVLQKRNDAFFRRVANFEIQKVNAEEIKTRFTVKMKHACCLRPVPRRCYNARFAQYLRMLS